MLGITEVRKLVDETEGMIRHYEQDSKSSTDIKNYMLSIYKPMLMAYQNVLEEKNYQVKL